MKFITIIYSYEEIFFTKFLSDARTARGRGKRLNYGDFPVLTLLNLEVCNILACSGGQVESIDGDPNFGK